jgi:hypothetical protein
MDNIIQQPLTSFTQRENDLITLVKTVMSPPFFAEFKNDNNRILGWINLVVGDIDYVAPLTDYDANTIPTYFDTAVVLGTQFYSMLFMEQKWSVQDISTSDGGFSIVYDRVSKISGPCKIFQDLYEKKVLSIKRNQMYHLVLGSPRLSGSLGMLVRMATR